MQCKWGALIRTVCEENVWSNPWAVAGLPAHYSCMQIYSVKTIDNSATLWQKFHKQVDLLLETTYDIPWSVNSQPWSIGAVPSM